MNDAEALMHLSKIEAKDRVACEACAGRGYIKQWIEGKPHTAHMGRCEQCSGLRTVKA